MTTTEETMSIAAAPEGSDAAPASPEEVDDGGVSSTPPVEEAVVDGEALVASLQEELAGRTARVQALEERVAGLERELGVAVQRYRQALLEASPELPGELLAGGTVDELETSLARARALVEQVRAQMETELARGRVPAGAPPRQGPDLARLSAREKIALGLERL